MIDRVRAPFGHDQRHPGHEVPLRVRRRRREHPREVRPIELDLHQVLGFRVGVAVQRRRCGSPARRRWPATSPGPRTVTGTGPATVVPTSATTGTVTLTVARTGAAKLKGVVSVAAMPRPNVRQERVAREHQLLGRRAAARTSGTPPLETNCGQVCGSSLCVMPPLPRRTSCSSPTSSGCAAYRVEPAPWPRACM